MKADTCFFDVVLYFYFYLLLAVSLTGDIVGVRLLTKKGTEEPKGCAFVEFSEGACVAQALKLHHSLMEGRKINVEKTVGGGGNGPNRRAKLTEKLDRLTRERQRHFNTVVREQAQQGYEYN